MDMITIASHWEGASWPDVLHLYWAQSQWHVLLESLYALLSLSGQSSLAQSAMTKEKCKLIGTNKAGWEGRSRKRGSSKKRHGEEMGMIIL